MKTLLVLFAVLLVGCGKAAPLIAVSTSTTTLPEPTKTPALQPPATDDLQGPCEMNIGERLKAFQDLPPYLRPLTLKASAPIVAKCALGEEVTDEDIQKVIKTIMCEPGMFATMEAYDSRLGTPTSEPFEREIMEGLFTVMCAESTPATPAPS